ncbi:MAG TPA: ABC transporter ATP-binding protein [Thermodesulfobacteriota bacterium]|nr:ABC transporter ATP-binding protein [Thermodesulfobacteriota bacterium]
MLKVRSLSIHYGNIQALKEISIDIDAREIVAFIGGNGAGKTTALKGISGLIRISSGGIEFLGEEIKGLAPEAIVKKGIAHCPEGRRVFPQLTVKENLEMGAYCRKDRSGISRDMEEVMAFFPILKERQEQAAGTFSGGQQQMLAIARALMSQPKLLMLDEPSLGLAPLIVDEIFSIIRQINKRGTAILLVEQNARMALDSAHKGYVLETGSITLQGKASELIDNEHVIKAYLGG